MSESQFVNRDLMQRVSEAGGANPEGWRGFCNKDMGAVAWWSPAEWNRLLKRTAPQKPNTDHVLDRALGQFAGISLPTTLAAPNSSGCCTGNCTQALYYAWESIVRCNKDGEATAKPSVSTRKKDGPWQ